MGIEIITYNYILAALLILFMFCYMLLLYYAWQNRETPISISYGLGVAAAFFYTFGYAFQLLSNSVEQMMFWIHIQYFGIAFAPFIWIVMTLQFTGFQRLITKKSIGLLLLGPVYTLTAHFTNNWHHLFYKNAVLDYSQGFPLLDLDRGILFYMHILYAYTYHLAGVALLIYCFIRSNKEQKKQVSLMIAGSLFVFGFPFIHSIGVIKVPIDISPFGLIFSSLFYLWGIHKFNMLKLSPLVMKKVFESINDAVIILDLDNHLKLYNKAAEYLFTSTSFKKNIGYKASDVFGQFPSLIQVFEDSEHSQKSDTKSIRLKDDYFNVHFSYVYGNNKPIGKMYILNNVTELVKYEESLVEQSKQFEYLAHHDMLTHLYNRTYFEETVQQKLKENKETAALILCDLNFFKEINDLFGHLIGDQVLQFTAQSFQKNLPQPNILARLGGDEFIMYFEGILDKEKFLQQIHQVRQYFHLNMYQNGSIEIEVVPSVGIAYTNEDGTNYESLYHICDVRMYADKKEIKERFLLPKY